MPAPSQINCKVQSELLRSRYANGKVTPRTNSRFGKCPQAVSRSSDRKFVHDTFKPMKQPNRSPKLSLFSVWTAFVAIAAALMLPVAVHAQGITTAGIGGFVIKEGGAPVSGATVVVTHEPSGTRSTTVTRSNGQYSLSGLRPGGPYKVSITAPGGDTAEKTGVFLEVGNTTDASVTMGASQVVTMEAFNVSAEKDLTFNSEKMGTGSTFGADAIANVSTVRNSIQDVAQLDSRLYLGSLDQGGQLSAQGQNFRFNSLLIDGVQAVDPYGLNSNGFSSLGSPIPLEALESMSIQISPYDTRYAGFTGAMINVITRSGTNDYRGTLYYQITNESLRAKNPLTGAKEPFDEKKYGLNVSGPILRDRLFFALTYDKVERTTVPPQANFVPDAAGLAAIDSIIARAKALGYDAGSLSGPGSNLTEQETYLGKLDWNISSQHRLSTTYRRVYGSFSNFVNYSSDTSTSLSHHWFDQPRNTDSYTAQFNSQWTPDFRTEATASYSKYDGSPKNRGTPFPMVRVLGITGRRLDTGTDITGGSVYFGTENSRQLNFITTKEKQFKLNGDYSWGNHTFTAGLEEVSTTYNNAFVQNTMGNYTFATPQTWIAGTPPSGYQLQKPFSGFTIQDAVAHWTYDAYAGFIQDTWRPNQRLTLMAGLRYDYPYTGQKPPKATNFANAGFRSEDGTPVNDNTTTFSGNATLAPRVGFTLKLSEDGNTQVRGGVGLFQGRNPAVWLTNAYQNAGAVYNYTAQAAERPLITFNPDPNTQTVPGSANPSPNINVTDPSLRQPALWKSNIAFEHKLPFGGLQFTAEYYHNIVQYGLNTEYLNYAVSTDGPATTPDGRIRYGAASAIVSSSFTSNTSGRRRVASFADVLYLTNANKGRSRGFTLALNRPITKGWGWSASWTNAEATEVSPITSSTAGSNYSNRAVFNPNEDIASTANTSIKNNIVVTLTRRFEFIKHAPTVVSMAFIARSGHPYSWVFYGDANGDGYTFNDLFYVPTGPNDPSVVWADSAQRDAFFKFVDSSSLKNYKGTHPGRNSETSPWVKTADLTITQTIPLFRGVRAELFGNIVNFGNLINDDWGLQEEVPFSFRRAVAGATYNATGNGGKGVWNYNFTSTTLNGVPVTVNDFPVSRWQVQIGMRLKF